MILENNYPIGYTAFMQPHEEPYAAAFAAKLREFRLAAGMTQTQLGTAVVPPIPTPHVSRYESGKRLPTWEIVIRFAKALGVTPDAFLPQPAKKPRKS